MYLRLCASFYTSYIVSHRVQAGLSGVYLDYDCQLLLAALQLLFPVDALRLTIVQHQRLWVSSLLYETQVLLRSYTHASVVVIRIGLLHVAAAMKSHCLLFI